MAKGRNRKRTDATGRNPDAFGRDNSVVIIRRSLWQSPLVSALSPTARALIVELLSMYNGSNNGRLFLSVKDATDRLGFSDWRAPAAAIAELEAVNLITVTVDAYFDLKAGVHSRARAWHLNWIGGNGERLAPEALPPLDEGTLEPRSRKRLQRRQKALKRYFKEHAQRKFAVVDSTTLEARMPENRPNPTVVSTTLESENGQKLPNRQMGETTAHLSYQGGVGSASVWWTAETVFAARVRLQLAVLAWMAPQQLRAAA